MIYAFIIIFGLVFGSFFLVVGTRLPEEKSIVKPGSQCDNCHKKISLV
jgi:leader peptidase (prepilin peptidase)/N-methyltransferase